MKPARLSVLIPDGGGDIALHVARALGAVPGVTVHALAAERMPPIRFSRRVSGFNHHPGGPDVEQILEFAKKKRVDVLLPAAEPLHQFVATYRAQLSAVLAIPPLAEAALQVRMINKWTLSRMLHEHGIPTPGTVLLSQDEECFDAVRQLVFPVLLKPVVGGDGIGIRRFDTPDAFFRVLAHENLRSGEWILQSFVEGHDIDCNLLCRDGEILAYSIQKGCIYRKRPYTPPAGIEFLQDERVLSIAGRWAAAAGWSGVAHIDLRVEAVTGEVHLLEVNARYWGSLPGSVAAGVNFPYLACLAALEIPFDRPAYKQSVFVSGSEAISAWAAGLSGSGPNRLSLRDTSWRFAAQDPLAELVRLTGMAVRRAGAGRPRA